MSLNITFIGHSAFLLDDGNEKLLIDPFITGNPVARHKVSDIDCTYIALTHGHSDHFGDTVAIAKKSGATVVANFEICNHCSELGVESVEPANPGGTIRTRFGSVTFVHAFHSSSLDGKYMGMPNGLVISMGGTTFYHCGDTGIFGDMKLIGEIYRPAIAAIPAGDRFTMGPELATRAAEMIRPKYAIPIHYGTFGALVQEVSSFRPNGVEVKVMKPGDSWAPKLS